MYLSCPWDHAEESLVSFGVGEVGVWGGTGSLAGISEELHLMCMAALGSIINSGNVYLDGYVLVFYVGAVKQWLRLEYW